MRFRNIAALLAAVLIALPAAAQEQRGAIEGIVKDSQGAAIAGSTVVAKRDNGQTFESVSDATGSYRFPSVPPGHYTVTASLSGFSSAKVEAAVTLGETVSLGMTLKVSGLAETIQVTAEAPLVDVKASARAANLRDEAISKMPKGRDFTSLVTQAPGVNLEQAKFGATSRTDPGGGISIDGAAPGENRYIIDGAETTELRSGTSGKVLITDFVDEVQVKSSGYTAEYGGATGGVINAITRTGSNAWRGDIFSYFSGDALNGSSRPTLRLVPTNSNAAEYVTYPEDQEKSIEPGFTFGGPLKRDKIWLFAGYNPSFNPVDRTVAFRADNVVRTTPLDFTRHNATANITAQLNSQVRARVAVTSSGYKQKGRLADLAGTSSPTANFAIDDISSNYSGSAGIDYTPSNKLFLHAQASYYRYNLTNEGVFQGSRYIFNTSNVGMAGVPANLQAAVGTSNVPTNTSTDHDIRNRTSAQADLSYFFSAGGQHQFKAGVQMDRIANDVLTGETGNRMSLFWDRQLEANNPASRGQFGYYSVRSNGVSPQLGFITVGDVKSNNLGLFIQDSWTINNKLTLNLGLRTENEHVPNFVVSMVVKVTIR